MITSVMQLTSGQNDSQFVAYDRGFAFRISSTQGKRSKHTRPWWQICYVKPLGTLGVTEGDYIRKLLGGGGERGGAKAIAFLQSIVSPPKNTKKKQHIKSVLQKH